MYWRGFRLPKFTWNLSAQLMQQSQDHVKIYKVEAKLHLLLEPWIHLLCAFAEWFIPLSEYWGFASGNESTWAEVVRRWMNHRMQKDPTTSQWHNMQIQNMKLLPFWRTQHDGAFWKVYVWPSFAQLQHSCFLQCLKDCTLESCNGCRGLRCQPFHYCVLHCVCGICGKG